MKMYEILNEGLKAGDLASLVIPLISIDEFESKIEDNAVVLGFYVKDEEPAVDLNRFIQKSSVGILDTEFSNTATDDGYYMVFVEIARNSETPLKIYRILKSLIPLIDVGINDWQFTIYHHDGVYDLTPRRLEIMLRVEPKETDDELEEV